MAFRTNKTPVLQEKTASGSVASFNTALAMPLASCNIAVNAWQEGSGDPSPVNNRPIHGWTASNVTRAGKNLFDKTKIIQGKWLNLDTGAIETTSPVYCISDYIFLKAGVTYRIPDTATSRRWIYDLNKQPIQRVISNTTFTFTPSEDCYLLLTIYTVQVSIDTYQIEAGSTATEYEPYVTPTIYPIQLGQEVYGAEVDVVNGVATITHMIIDLGSVAWRYYRYGSYDGGYTTALASGTNSAKPYSFEEIPNALCNKAIPHEDRGFDTCPYNTFTINSGSLVKIKVEGVSTAEELQTALLGTMLVYELATSFDIQLTPTQIETLIGNNTIFADTGDVDLTFNDLDIAKRGSFREVFKLP